MKTLKSEAGQGLVILAIVFAMVFGSAALLFDKAWERSISRAQCTEVIYASGAVETVCNK